MIHPLARWSSICCISIYFVILSMHSLSESYILELFTGRNAVPSFHHGRSLSESNSSSISNSSRDVSIALNVTLCTGPGCPYAAAWLIDVSTYLRTGWNLASRKMEEASFNVFRRAQAFQTDMSYHVKHMSAYEHSVVSVFNKNKKSRDEINHMIYRYARALFLSQCSSVVVQNETDVFLALIPFYSGQPPNVTREDGIGTEGEGHSRAPVDVKAIEAVATVCSALKYFGRVVVGVTSEKDEALLIEKVRSLNLGAFRHRVQVVRFHNIPRPSALPFHVLTWGQRFVLRHNCQRAEKSATYARAEASVGLRSSVNATTGASPSHLFVKPDSSSFEVCKKYSLSGGSTANVLKEHYYVASEPRMRLRDQPIRYVYYTEMDQVVHFDSMDLFKAIYGATNGSIFFVAKRAERVCSESESPEDFDKSLYFRTCGRKGYQLRWPDNNYVHVLS